MRVHAAISEYPGQACKTVGNTPGRGVERGNRHVGHCLGSPDDLGYYHCALAAVRCLEGCNSFERSPTRPRLLLCRAWKRWLSRRCMSGRACTAGSSLMRKLLNGGE